LVLINSAYMQHSILEAGAHYCDFPWRTANNINNPGFPEPVYYAGDKRVFIGNQFYDVSNPTRRELHRTYIRHQLDELGDKPNVIHLTSEEYTGPLQFVQFWLDTISEWEKETGKKPLIGLSATKDVQDAILADPQRAAVVNVIDIRYWHYQSDGQAYAPKGGINLAPRQHARLLKPEPTSFEQIARAVSEYRIKYPDKAVIYSAEGPGEDKDGWGTLMGGGSLAALRTKLDPALASEIATMTPKDPNVLGDDKGENYLVHGGEGAKLPFDPAGFAKQSVDSSSGRVVWFKKKP
jgi:hypothetical protein